MSHPVVHAEIRSSDPDATRAFFADLFGWRYSDGAYPGYTSPTPASTVRCRQRSARSRATPTPSSSSSA